MTPSRTRPRLLKLKGSTWQPFNSSFLHIESKSLVDEKKGLDTRLFDSVRIAQLPCRSWNFRVRGGEQSTTNERGVIADRGSNTSGMLAQKYGGL